MDDFTTTKRQYKSVEERTCHDRQHEVAKPNSVEPTMTTSSCSSSHDDGGNNNSCKFQRDWLRNLLEKHAHNHPNMPPSLQTTALVSAPMVDASDLPYRLLTRRYNTNLCFTPMIHAKMFSK